MRQVARVTPGRPAPGVPFAGGARARLAVAGTRPQRRGFAGDLFGRTAPERTVRQTLTPPALVIGHPRDPVHPFSDADMLAPSSPTPG